MSHVADKVRTTIISACMRADGAPTFVRTEVDVTPAERANGVHYDLAEAQLVAAGYEEPCVHFDDREAPTFLAAAVTESVAAAMAVPDLTTDNPPEKA